MAVSISTTSTPFSTKQPVLGYWNIRGLGQPIRFLLAYLNVDYEHRVYEYGPLDPDLICEDYRKERYTMGLDFPNLPYWIDSKVKLCETTAIMKHLCMNYNGRSMLAPNEEAEVQYAMVENCLVLEVWHNIRELTFGRKTIEDFESDNKPRLQQFSDYLSSKPWIMGDNISYVDFYMYEVLTRHQVYNETWITQNLQTYLDRFEALPAIAQNLKTSTFVKRPYSAPDAKIALMPKY